MPANLPDRAPRRIAVILGSSSSSRRLLEQLLPLLGDDRDVEMQGVFLEEAEIQHAAELPFVQELCRVTFSVREFTSDQFEHALNLRMRTARRALSVLADRTGVVHSFRNVRGSAVKLVRETAIRSDVTVFEPMHLRTSSIAPAVRPYAQRGRIVAVVNDPGAARMTLAAAARLSAGVMDRVTVLLSPTVAAGDAALEKALVAFLPGVRVRKPSGEGLDWLVAGAQAAAASIVVLDATAEILEPGALQFLRMRLHCPICLVRQRDHGPEHG